MTSQPKVNHGLLLQDFLILIMFPGYAMIDFGGMTKMLP